MLEHDPRIDPEELRAARFPGSSRRYDAKAVNRFLESLAERIVATNQLVDELARRVEEAEAAPPPPARVDREQLADLSEDELVGLIGEETASVLATARRAAEDIRTKAEDNAARVIREATDEAKQKVEAAGDRVVELTSEAESARDLAVEAAEAEAERIRQEAERDAHRVLADAKEEARVQLASVEERRVAAQDEAAALLVEAREEGRAMVAEAKEVRGRILDDLQRRRDTARTQIIRLTEGRDRLLVAYDKVRRSLDEITGHLEEAVPAEAAAVAPPAEERDDTVAPGDDDDLDAQPPEDTETAGTVAGESLVVEPADHEAAEDEATGDEPAADDTVAPIEDDTVVPDDEDTVAPAVDDDTVALVEADDPDAASDDDAGDTDDTGDTGGTEGAGESGEVDALFARLRAEREASVQRAHEVLDEGAGTTPGIGAASTTTIPDPADVAADHVDDDTSDAASGSDAEREDVSRDEAGEAAMRIPAELLAPVDVLAERAAAVEAGEKALGRSLKRHLADEQNEVLDRLRRADDVSVDGLFLDTDTHRAGYRDVAVDHLRTVMAAGATVAGGDDAEVDAAALDSLAAELAASIVDPFRRRVERAIESVAGDPDDLDERLRPLYREWKAQQLPAAVADTLLSAFAWGTLGAMAPGAGLRWTIDPEQGPCPDAEDNALAGTVQVGEVFPTGDSCPQAHPGCRCLVVPADV